MPHESAFTLKYNLKFKVQTKIVLNSRNNCYVGLFLQFLVPLRKWSLKIIWTRHSGKFSNGFALNLPLNIWHLKIYINISIYIYLSTYLSIYIYIYISIYINIYLYIYIYIYVYICIHINTKMYILVTAPSQFISFKE